MIRRRHDITPPPRVAPPTDPELEGILDHILEDDEDDEDEDETLDADIAPEEINERILDHR